jgi:hypothetical protein
MNADEAKALLDRMTPVPECSLCGMKNPPTEERDSMCGMVNSHKGCPREDGYFVPSIEPGGIPLLNPEEARDALTTIIHLYEKYEP